MNQEIKQKKKKNDFPAFGLDAYAPEQVVDKVMQVGVKKVRLPYSKTFALGTLGGIYVSLGALYQVVVMANPDISPTMAAVMGPLFFVIPDDKALSGRGYSNRHHSFQGFAKPVNGFDG